ncbi:hypothetical protein DH2020_043774 [Rehmannia glutinosa]|uniref:GRAM domain-containing protein n=1 Tax=Rehmannia glutinosa TaxID=99300 RepID=A0ABR0UIQ3_REHGL
MEVQHRKSRLGNKNLHKEHAIGIPISSAEYEIIFKSSTNALLPDPASQYQLMPSPSKHYSKNNIRHMKLGPKLSETVKGKLSLGARILQVGGVEKVFKQKFSINREDEKLLKASQCYLSTTAGPIAGLLFISNDRVAFCSERSIKVSSPTGKLVKLHYKVMIPLRKIKRAIESENVKKPTQKYVQIVTEDNFEFWFMGFLNHQTTLKYLQQAIHQAR